MFHCQFNLKFGVFWTFSLFTFGYFHNYPTYMTKAQVWASLVILSMFSLFLSFFPRSPSSFGAFSPLKLLGWQCHAVCSVCFYCSLCLVSLFLLVGTKHAGWLHGTNREKCESASCCVLIVFNLCFTAPRGDWGENHRRLGGAALLHQAPGLPPLHELPLLRRHPHPPAVGGVCCPLLETVSGCTRAVTLPWKAWLWLSETSCSLSPKNNNKKTKAFMLIYFNISSKQKTLSAAASLALVKKIHNLSVLPPMFDGPIDHQVCPSLKIEE